MTLIGNLHTPGQDNAFQVVEKKSGATLKELALDHCLSIDGKVVDIIDADHKARGPLATKSIDSLAYSYLGQTPYPLRDSDREIQVLYKVEPTKILTFGKP